MTRAARINRVFHRLGVILAVVVTIPWGASLFYDWYTAEPPFNPADHGAILIDPSPATQSPSSLEIPDIAFVILAAIALYSLLRGVGWVIAGAFDE